MLELICGLLRSDFASVMLLDDTRETLRSVASIGLPESITSEPLVSGVGVGLAGRVAESGEPLVIDDLDELENANPVAARAGAQSGAAVPLLVGKRLVGVVGVASKEKRLYEPDDVRLLGIAAERMAAAIDRSTTELELERRVAERTAALEDANAELDAFSYSVSHDLRAPLRAMKGFSRALLEDYGPALGDGGTEFAVRVVAAAERMDELIDQLLEFSRLSREEITSDRVDIDVIVDEVLAALGPRVAESEGSVEVTRPLGAVDAHAATLALVLSNLIDNALKFTTPGLVPRVRIRSAQAGACVRVEVEDDGIGVAVDNRRRIFDVFERLHAEEAYPGTGVGLASVKKSVARMGGTVGVDSEPGLGSTFWFELPAA
jgi:signal transduction histidine kinase